MFSSILISVILPVFVIIGIGWLLDRAFTLDQPTLSKLNFYVFLPALMFVMLLNDRIGLRELLAVGAFTTLHMLLLFGLSWGLFSFGNLQARRTVMSLGVALNNCGNFGIPLVLLAFGTTTGSVDTVGVLTVIIMVQNLATFTGGIWLMEREKPGGGSILLNIARLPVLYVIILAFVMRWQHWVLPKPIAVPVNHLADGLIAVALLTLGVQLSRARLTRVALPVVLITGARLLVAPLLAVALLPFFHFGRQIDSILIVAAGFPVAVNLTILSAEYRRDEDLASQSIFISTLLSGVTLAVILALVR